MQHDARLSLRSRLTQAEPSLKAEREGWAAAQAKLRARVVRRTQEERVRYSSHQKTKEARRRVVGLSADIPGATQLITFLRRE